MDERVPRLIGSKSTQAMPIEQRQQAVEANSQDAAFGGFLEDAKAKY